ncbi:serine hydrolase domain-containing protein [Flaviaesturariibacter aridisoli]|uniref:Class A beta-lactamase-related serine hydrolase n=1 Tax=Flaviaesturariibacter aridisoli TaxID=2545761 RepID=A0A4R4E273_9BACT|nr:serine hydrolase domain-containing protein [Flaviaesturariibacter aridisoli]TCZ69307.1 class A beta-lactamase-related serine hydrolase [Flaviaesturariibacter aridisoli]
MNLYKLLPVAGLGISLLLGACKGGANVKVETVDTLDNVARMPVPTLPEDVKKRYHDNIAAFMNRTGFLRNFNGSILIAKNGVPVYEYYGGYRDYKKKDSLTAETPLQIASTSKPFTAAAVLQLVEQGKVGLDDLLTKYFPGFPYSDITVRMLLNHRSGLPNYLYYMDKQHWPDQRKLATNADVLQSLMTWNLPRNYRANVHFSYNNTNYVLLALLVEKVTGQDFPSYMKKNFFERFGMKDTYIKKPTDLEFNMSYQRNNAPWPLDFSDGPYGDKNIYSTPRDLLKWDQAWYAGLVIGPALTDSAFTPNSNERPSIHNYGLGWRLLSAPNNKKVIYHNGHWHGFNSAFARLVQEKGTVIILSNRFNPAVYPFARALYNAFGNYDGKQPEGEE